MTSTAGDRLAAELEQLAALDLAALSQRWRKIFGRTAPPGLSPTLLHRALAYRIQAKALGDLDRETARWLDRLARAGRIHSGEGESEGKAGTRAPPGTAGPGAGEVGGRSTREGKGEVKAEDLIPLPGAALRPGTTIVREWRGVLHSVVVLESGFAWNGVTYDSLSAAARAITGTNWNGPRFFGLRSKTSPFADGTGR